MTSKTMASWRLSSKRTWAVGVLALSLILSDCAAAPRLSDSSPASTAPLIPVAVFFANRESNYDYKVSPDGGRLAWLASAGGRLTVHFRELQGGDAGTGREHADLPRLCPEVSLQSSTPLAPGDRGLLDTRLRGPETRAV